MGDYAAGGQGATLWNVDGNVLLDWILAYGIIVLGHRDPDVDAAAIHEIRDGSHPGNKRGSVPRGQRRTGSRLSRSHDSKGSSDRLDLTRRVEQRWIDSVC
jgi:acetylornithine/succinyldiaminopimelate/putrescine aminotransferase